MLFLNELLTGHCGAAGCQIQSVCPAASWKLEPPSATPPYIVPWDQTELWESLQLAVHRVWLEQHRGLSSESQTESQRNLHFSLVLGPAAEHSPAAVLCAWVAASLSVVLPGTRNGKGQVRLNLQKVELVFLSVILLLLAAYFLFLFFFNSHQQNRKCRVYDFILKNKSPSLHPLFGALQAFSCQSASIWWVCLVILSSPNHQVKCCQIHQAFLF